MTLSVNTHHVHTLASGRGIIVETATGKADLNAAVDCWFPCSWSVPVFHPEPDSPSDLIGPCGAPAAGMADGWACANGHLHESFVEYYDDEEVAHMARNHITPAPGGRHVSGARLAA